jgi:acetyltransferase-like isoleucine patch superfamily enzyme
MKMIYDVSFLEHIREIKKGKGGESGHLMNLAIGAFNNPTFICVITVFEAILRLFLILPIPVYRDFVLAFITALPGNPLFLGNYLRGIYWSGRLAKVGKNFIVEQGVVIRNPQGVEISDFVLIDRDVIVEARRLCVGRRVHIAERSVIFGGGECIIDDYAGLSAETMIITASDTPAKGYRASGPMVPWGQRKVDVGRVRIGKDAFIGPRVVIFNNVEVGEGAVIVAGTVITKNAEEYKIYLGSPARARASRQRVEFEDK